jgi:hypothetical protein
MHRTGDIVSEAWCGVQTLTPRPAVVLSILDTNRSQALASGGI